MLKQTDQIIFPDFETDVSVMGSSTDNETISTLYTTAGIVICNRLVEEFIKVAKQFDNIVSVSPAEFEHLVFTDQYIVCSTVAKMHFGLLGTPSSGWAYAHKDLSDVVYAFKGLDTANLCCYKLILSEKEGKSSLDIKVKFNIDPTYVIKYVIEDIHEKTSE